ncbi:LOW QUALITY PROTEIN: uncharacterized protein LOC142741727 [Rhinoderma darwinii]|uniref:LOW QUALITY PROTEIN: uncharacterized protein LOC142741727 n=1 Tax=Rhinoderma darwinii TaxID=43563 RepID=UPI003F6804A3
MCCSAGKVQLPPLTAPPEPLKSLMTVNTPQTKHFLGNLRCYNSCFRMISFGVNEIRERGFMPTFKIQGQVCHRLGSLLPLPNEPPNFLQIYFMGDEKLQVQQQQSNVPGTRADILLELQHMLHEHHCYVEIFKSSLEIMTLDNYKVVINADRRPTGEHERRYNAPTHNDVTVVIVGEFENQDIVLQKRDNQLQRVSETHRSYDALQYPLIFWQGEDEYNIQIFQTNPTTGTVTTGKKVLCMAFYAYRIMMRKTLCAESYIHLRDAVVNDGNTSNVGQMVILPSSFAGSPRHMHEYTQDSMTICENGRPDLFITFTCNSTWKEQSATDRHDLVARVFRQKVIKFMNVLTKGKVFEETQCFMCTIEWQKRGLPHAHILIWLKEKIRPNQIDSVISAEILNAQEDQKLFDIIMKNMVHGPCGRRNPSSPCMKDGFCTKRFPRQLIHETQSGDDGYPLYRRRKVGEGGFTALMKMKIGNSYQDIEVDNRWIVPYSPFLSKTFQSHVNIEYCNSVKAIKYICRYVNKGSDQAAFGLERQGRTTDEINRQERQERTTDEINHQERQESTIDEIDRFQTGRYISSNDAVWRILDFPIHDRYLTVVHLNAHLENGHAYLATNEPLVVSDQTTAYNQILDTVVKNTGGIVFLDAPGGTGNTFVINLLLAKIRQQSTIALAVASSGIAATLIDGGRTAHSAFKLPLNLTRDVSPVCNISKGTGVVNVLQECLMIVWDKYTMAHKLALEALDRTLQDLRGNNTVIGGVVLVLAGDFRQTLPIVPKGTPADELKACLKQSVLWRHVKKMSLTTNMRVHVHGDATAGGFASRLLNLWNGDVKVDNGMDLISFHDDFANFPKSVEELTNSVFPNIVLNYRNHEWLCQWAILAPKNDSVNAINQQIQMTLPGQVKLYKSTDTVTDPDQAVYYPTEFLNSLSSRLAYLPIDLC